MFYSENLYAYLINLNITSNQLETFILIFGVLYSIVEIYILVAIYYAYGKWSYKKRQIATGVSIVILALSTWMLIFLLIQTDNYTKYIDSNLKKYTYEVTSISKDKKLIHTKYGTFDNNSEDSIKTIEVPTTDKSKVGKTYYKTTVYRPQKFAKLSKHKNKLVEYKYIYSTPADK